VKIAKIDGDVNNAVLLKFGVRGFPTIVFINDNMYTIYNGDKSFESINDFAYNGQATTPMVTKEDTVKLLQKQRVLKDMKKRKDGKKNLKLKKKKIK
jgi:hypothetical protein